MDNIIQNGDDLDNFIRKNKKMDNIIQKRFILDKTQKKHIHWTCFLIFLYVVMLCRGKFYHPLRACSRTGTKINKLTIDKIDARSKSRNQVHLGYALQGGKRRSQLTFFTH